MPRSPSRPAALMPLATILLAPRPRPAATRDSPTRTDTTVGVTQSGIWGGGFMNVIARDTSKASHRYVIGGDTAGLLTSDDDGTTWTASNAGLQDISQTTIAAAVFRRPPHDNE